MALLLHLETATTVCAVALAENGRLLYSRELDAGYTHAENLHVFIREMLREAQVTASQLESIAVSKGPGSYTGLRIGVSAAKGLAYALGIPLIGIDTLQIMSQVAIEAAPGYTHYCPMIDARRMEVYTAVYKRDLEQLMPVEALIVDAQSISRFAQLPAICFFGDGMDKCRSTLNHLPDAHFVESIRPGAKAMCGLAYGKYQAGQFENLAYFEPFYLKDFLITKKGS